MVTRSVLQLALKVQTGDRNTGVSSPVLVWEASGPAAGGDAAPLSPQVTETFRLSLSRPEPGNAVFFEVRKRANAGNPFAMGVTLGRADTNDVPLEDASVSRFHAWLQQEPRTGAWKLVDAESLNGTWVGALKLAPKQPEQLSDGARLRLGSVDLLFLQPPAFLAYLARYRRA